MACMPETLSAVPAGIVHPIPSAEWEAHAAWVCGISMTSPYPWTGRDAERLIEYVDRAWVPLAFWVDRQMALSYIGAEEETPSAELEQALCAWLDRPGLGLLLPILTVVRIGSLLATRACYDTIPLPCALPESNRIDAALDAYLVGRGLVSWPSVVVAVREATHGSEGRLVRELLGTGSGLSTRFGGVALDD
jgi:hypothetical protein